MDRLWKYLSGLILLQLAMMAYIFLRLPNTSKVHSDSTTLRISKKDLNISGEQGTFNINTDVIKSNKSGKHLPLAHKRFYLQNNSFYFKGEVQLEARHEKVINLRKLKRKPNFFRGNRNDFLESKESATTETTNTTLITTYALLNHSNITTKCIFSFDKKSFSEAQKTVSTSQSVYLFYINLKINDSTSFDDKPEKDSLFHWQYILKKEKLLVQLPVDFDLFTFRLLYADNEEVVLDVNLHYNNSNCERSENLTEETHAVRALLWNELFHNDTRFYLCNRYIQDGWGWRDIQYLITTIWVGYDLNCSEVGDEYGVHEVQLTKDDLPLVTPIFCYFLSLQFVWIFVLLDVFKKPQRSDELTHYSEDDRPYSAKRFIKKILYKECDYCICYCCCCCDQCKRRKCRCCSDHVRRLLFLTWFFILLPVGLYRTLGRFCILDKDIYQDYLTVVKPSEFLFSLIRNKEFLVLCLDTLYATFFPLFFVFIGERSYKIIASDNQKKETQKVVEEEMQRFNTEGNRNEQVENPRHSTNNRVNENFKPVIEIFSKPCGELYEKLKLLVSGIICCNCTEKNEPDVNKYGKKRCCCYKYSKNGENGKCDCKFVYAGGYVFSSFLCCLFPIIPFGCAFKCACKNCNNSKEDNSVENHVCGNKCKGGTLCQKFCCLLWATFKFISIYFLCLRPIISTFTFMFMAFTYFVCVTLLIRTHMMQFTLICVTTLAYFLNYLSEIINMNVDILKYIITHQKKHDPNIKPIGKQTNQQNDRQDDMQNNEQSANLSDKETAKENDEQIDPKTIVLKDRQNDNQSDIENASQHDSQNIEPIDNQNDKVDGEKFTYIHEHLKFVRKKIYLLCLKTLVIFLYLFITIETFIRNKTSLNETSVKTIVEFLLLIIGPYAISFFLKTNKGDFLSDENKLEIEQKLKELEEKELKKENKTITKCSMETTNEQQTSL